MSPALVLRFRVPAARTAESAKPFKSFNVTLLADGIVTVAKSLARSKVTSLPDPAVKELTVEGVLAIMAPLWVIAPLALTVKLPVTCELPRSNALTSLTVTSAPTNFAVAKSLFAFARVMLLPGVLNLAVLPAPLAIKAPLWVMGPPAVTVRLPLAAVAPRSNAFTSLTDTSAPVNLAVLKSLLPARVMLLPEELNEAVLPAPLARMAPL